MTSDQPKLMLSDEQKSRIYGILSVGCDRQTAADYIGCSLGHLRSAMQDDVEFTKEVRRSEAEAEFKHMLKAAQLSLEKRRANPPLKIRVILRENSRAERRYRGFFGRRIDQIHQHGLEGYVEK